MKAHHGIIGETFLKFSDHGRLRAWLLVFEYRKDMAQFLNKRLTPRHFRTKVQSHTAGMCIPLSTWNERYGADGNVIRCGPKHHPTIVCVICLLRRHLTMKVISHEAMHAGFAYAKRVKASPWSTAFEFDEEHVCYPAGEIAEGINRFLYRRELYAL